MKPNNIKHYLALSFCFVSLFLIASNINAQKKQARGGNKTQVVTSNAEENKQVLSDIEMLREEIAARKALQDQQREMLQNLQNKIGGGEETEINADQFEIVNISDVYNNTEADELDIKFDLEMQMAEREIEILREQLELANIELDQCRRERDASAIDFFPATELEPAQIYQPDTTPAPIKATKLQKAKKTKPATKITPAKVVVVEEVIIQQVSDENQQVMDDIELLKEKIKQRKEQQDKQRRELEILQEEVGSQF